MIRVSSAQPITVSPDYAKNIASAPAIRAESAPPASAEQAPPVQRLVVLVPDAEVDEARLAAKLWTMASGPGLNIILLSLVRNTFREASVQRRLTTIAAITRDKRTHVEVRLGAGAHWESLIQSIWQTGDLLVCHAEQSKSVIGIGREPLAPVLASALKVPVYALAGFYPELPPELPESVGQVFAAAPLVAIVTAFFFVLAGIQRLTAGLVQTVLFCLSVIIVYGLIATWETLVAYHNN
jgi:hypothetical protein